MAANEKNLTKSMKGNKALTGLTDLATQILNATKINKSLIEKLSLAKKELNEHCIEIFLKDLTKGEIYGNHTIDTPGGKLTVNFRMGPQCDISEYEKTLKADFKDNYADLFVEIPTIEVTTAYPNQKIQFEAHPELFVISLKRSVTMVEMTKIFKKFPDSFDLIIKDKKNYSEVYPASVEITKKIFPAGGILEKLANLEITLRKRILGVLTKFFDKNIECAVKI
jgi:hypothetical protein